MAETDADGRTEAMTTDDGDPKIRGSQKPKTGETETDLSGGVGTFTATKCDGNINVHNIISGDKRFIVNRRKTEETEITDIKLQREKKGK